MKHDWEDWYADPKKTPAQVFMGERQRACRCCGKVQTLQIEQAWGRVTGRRWMPLIGRCKGSTAPVPE